MSRSVLLAAASGFVIYALVACGDEGADGDAPDLQYYSPGRDAGADAKAPGPKGSEDCESSCEAGASRCGPGLESCKLDADGCYTWQSEPCRGQCQDDEGEARCVEAASCGNGVVDEGEICDPGAAQAKTCADLGFTGGELACAEDCLSYNDEACTGLTLGRYATLSGINGRITTLATYSGSGAAHPGVNAIDIGGGGEVWHQLDYLDAAIEGGFMHVFRDNSTSICASVGANSPNYNGDKIGVETYFFNAARRYLGYHRATHQHVVPGASIDKWFSWRKDGSTLWPAGDLTLNNTTDGGVALGTVYVVNQTRYVNGVLCTTGTHLHQESQGMRSQQRSVGETMQQRYNDLHYFTSLNEGCGKLTYQGQCIDEALLWCEGGTVRLRECNRLGQSCQFKDESTGFTCQ